MGVNEDIGQICRIDSIMNCKRSSRSNLQKGANPFVWQSIETKVFRRGTKNSTKNPGHHLSTYQQMQLTRQKGRLNRLSPCLQGHCRSKWLRLFSFSVSHTFLRLRRSLPAGSLNCSLVDAGCSLVKKWSDCISVARSR